MKHEFAVRAVHVASFAHSAGRHDGVAALSEFDRLQDVAEGAPEDAVVYFSVQGEVRTNGAGSEEPWLRLAASTSLNLVCQRCLAPATVPVSFARDFRFVANEARAAMEDEASEEDVLVLSNTFDLLALVEDELLMAMPPVPKHEVCPQPVRMQAADPDFDVRHEEKPHPFAALQQLKGKGLSAVNRTVRFGSK
jgi:uncharacterized protein